MLIHLVTDRFSLGGGIEHIYQIVKGLKEFKFGIFAKSGRAEQKFKDLENVKIYTGGYQPGYVLKDKPDLVHIHHLRPLFFFFKKRLAPATHGSISKRTLQRYKIPVIFTAHGLHIHKYEFSGLIRDKLKYTLRFYLEKIILKKPAGVIAVSHEDRDFLEKKYLLKNVVYLTNGIDFTKISRTTGSKTDLRKELNLPARHFLFITVARFDYQKGYDILVQAIARLKEKFSRETEKIRFIFVGHGSEFERMKALSRELSVSEYISFLGERVDVYKLIKACDVFLLPSRWEGLPIVLLETGLLQIPVLASETYGNREILKGDKGILFKNEDVEELAVAIKDAAAGKYDLNRCARNLFTEVETNYNLGKMLNGLREIYSSYKTR
ncbi:MAG: glycosyltransferase family 4 protein [Candidatus Aminicenantes bacterium]|nr:glycosyltransferase family 4 protein [Candidatus Aminicenantes bacterium]